MQWFITVVVIVALGAAAVAAAGGLGEMGQPVRDYYRQDLPTDRPLSGAEVEGVQFAVTLRGYSMAQVDDLVERLAAEIAARDVRIRELGGDPADPTDRAGPADRAAVTDPARSAADGDRLEADGWGPPEPLDSDLSRTSLTAPSLTNPTLTDPRPTESGPRRADDDWPVQP